MPLNQVVVENWRGFGGRMLRSRPWHLARLLAAMSAKMKSQNSAESVLFAWISVMVCSIFATSEGVLSSLLQCSIFSTSEGVLSSLLQCSIFSTSEGVVSSLLHKLFYLFYFRDLCYLRDCSILSSLCQRVFYLRHFNVLSSLLQILCLFVCILHIISLFF